MNILIMSDHQTFKVNSHAARMPAAKVKINNKCIAAPRQASVSEADGKLGKDRWRS